jgi:ABC-type multidrug transport system fused ATPase/permease subunit
MPVLRRLLGYLRPYAWYLALSFVLMAAYAVVNAFSIVALIPFLEVLFRGEPAAAGPPPEGALARLQYFFQYQLFASSRARRRSTRSATCASSSWRSTSCDPSWATSRTACPAS